MNEMQTENSVTARADWRLFFGVNYSYRAKKLVDTAILWQSLTVL